MSYREYHYVGTKEILDASRLQPGGIPIYSAQDVANWLGMELAEKRNDGVWIATFTISTNQTLFVAPRRSEHVACASGGPVLSAGEIVFDETVAVVDISNQSTGFCPEPESWPAVQASLDSIGITHPGSFTAKVIFRRCPRCNERNIVKDSWFICQICESELPQEWNFHDPECKEN